MIKSETPNKKRRIWIIVGIIILVLIILFLILRFMFSWMWYSEQSYSPPVETDLEDDVAPVPPAKVYRTSDKLSELTFSRTINDDDLQADLNVVVKGYVREVESVTGAYGEKVFVLSDSTVQWDVDAKETLDHTNCLYEYTLSGTGEDEASNLDVPIGQESGSSSTHLDGWGDIALAYNSYGYGSSGRPEISFGGEVLIPVDYVESVTVTRPSQNVGAICNGFTESTSFTREGTINFAFPLVLSNAEANKKNYEGSAQLEEASYDSSGNARLNNIILAGTGALTIIPDENLWDVTWKVYLP